MGRGISRGSNADASQRRGGLVWGMDQFVTRGPRTGERKNERQLQRMERNLEKRKPAVQSWSYVETFTLKIRQRESC